MSENPIQNNINEVIHILKVGILIFRDNQLVEINQSAKNLLSYTDEKPLGEYTESIQSLLDIDENGYTKNLTGTVGKPLNAILHIQGDLKIVEFTESYETKLGEASHELRRPLTNIKTIVDTLYLWGAGEDPQARGKFLAQLHQQTERLVSMLTELLSLSRMQAGSTPITHQQIAFHTLVEETTEALQQQASEKNISLENQIPSDYVLIADGEKIHHIVQNLIENAIRYNKQDGKVTISPGIKPNSFVVSDTGCGIKQEDQPKVFERFKRVNKEVPGTGLGLSIVKTIVDLHGGKISLESEPGTGSSFTVVLPLQKLIMPPM